jgi:hypothetical protein
MSWQLSQADPKTAADFALSLPAGQSRNQFISQVASSWANNDLPGAIAWVQQLADGQGKQNALQSIILTCNQ